MFLHIILISRKSLTTKDAKIQKQAADKITGTYKGPLGEYQVTGTVTGAKAVFGFEFTQNGEKGKATYTATIESPTKMTGTVEFKSDSGSQGGKWVASRATKN